MKIVDSASKRNRMSIRDMPFGTLFRTGPNGQHIMMRVGAHHGTHREAIALGTAEQQSGYLCQMPQDQVYEIIPPENVELHIK